MQHYKTAHLGNGKPERSDNNANRNGYKSKSINSSWQHGYQGPSRPQVHVRITTMYAKGMSTRQIFDTQEYIRVEASEGFISDITDKIIPQIEDCQSRTHSEVYPILFIDAIHYSVRDNDIVRKLAAYVVLGINQDGSKEVLAIEVGENESAKYYLLAYLIIPKTR